MKMTDSVENRVAWPLLNNRRMCGRLHGMPIITPARSRGQTMLEFALVLPILLLLVLGMIEFSWFMNAQLTVANAAREGARAAAVGQTTGGINTRIDTFFTLNISKVVEVHKSTNNGTSWSVLGASGSYNDAVAGNLIRVRVTATYTAVTGFIPGLAGRQIIKEVIIQREPT